ncbi:MAG: helix-turn-helix domain-containing protein [Hyphomicrobiaceae bacterium]|nr:helix-turn-helix domain-containing protein [Hyphomicrobiaceae bacterium]
MENGRRLRELREAAGFSQTKLASMMDVSRNAISQWETGETQPSSRRLAKLAKILRVPIDTIMAPTQDVRDKILNAAERLFDRIGIGEASVDVICAAADVTQAQFEATFGTREALLSELIKRLNDSLFEQIRRMPPRYGSIAARLKYLIRACYVCDIANLKLVSALRAYSWQWDPAQERENNVRLFEYHELVMSLFSDAASRGQIRHGDFHAASALLYAAYVEGLRKANFERYDADRLVQHLEPQIMIILRGFGFEDIPGFSETSNKA